MDIKHPDPKHTAAHPITRYETTEYNRAERILSRLQDIYGRAKSFHLSHRAILDAVGAEIYASKDWAKLRPYYRGVFAGMHRCLAADLYRYHLEWRLYLDGALVRSADVPAGAWDRTKGGEHVWKDAPEKLFSSSEVK